MSLINDFRPKTWNSVIGQDRVLRVLKAILKNDKLLLRGMIFNGSHGNGKTTTAYLTAKSLMCTGTDPEDCNKCPSCKTILEQGIDSHPDFLEVDGASKAGIAEARDIVTTTESLAVLGKRRVSMIDEAHSISYDAWKTYLKPLEQTNTNAIFMFISNQGHKIPIEIRGRCCVLNFTKVDSEVILGLLVNIASTNHIQYELDALKLISKASKGIIREALNSLDVCAAIGNVTSALVKDTIYSDLEDSAASLLSAIGIKDINTALKIADQISQSHSSVKLIETMFSVYAKSSINPETENEHLIKQKFSKISAVTDLFIKWSSASHLPADVIPLFVLELKDINDVKVTKYVQPKPQTEDFISSSEFASLTGAVIQR